MSETTKLDALIARLACLEQDAQAQRGQRGWNRTHDLAKDIRSFVLMALSIVFILLATEMVLRQFGEHARQVSISVGFKDVDKLISCEERATVSACAQFIKAGWSYGGTWIALTVVTFTTTLLSLHFLRQMCNRFWTRIVVFGSVFLAATSVIANTESPGKLYELTGNSAASGAEYRSIFKLVFPALSMSEFLDLSIRVASISSAIAGAITAAACFATVLDLPVEVGPDGKPSSELRDARMSEISIRFYRLRVLIAMGAVFLVLGVFTTSGYLTWPMPFVKDHDAFKNLADGVLLIIGTEYSLLLLLGFFLPAGIIFLSARSLAIRSGKTSQKQIDLYLTEFGLNFSFPSVIKDSLTIVAPFIVSALASATKLSL